MSNSDLKYNRRMKRAEQMIELANANDATYKKLYKSLEDQFITIMKD